MRLRWYTDDEGERKLQFENMFGWHDVEETSAAEERRQERDRQERDALEFERARQDAFELSLPPHQRRALKAFRR